MTESRSSKRPTDLAARFVDARQRGDLAALRECLHPDLVAQSNLSPWPTDREQLLSATRDRHERLGGTRIEVVRLEALSDGFLLEEVLYGTYGDGRDIAVPCCVIATCDDTQITSVMQYGDSEAATPLLDDRGRVWRLAGTVARSSGRSAFTAVDIVRSAAALGMLVIVPLDPTSIDLDEFGSGIEDRAERAQVERETNGEAGVTIPCPAPALPSRDLMALAAHMTRPAMAGRRPTGRLADVIAALATNPPYVRQLAEAGIDPRPLATEWVARRDALPPETPPTPPLSPSELQRLEEVGGPTPDGWDDDPSDRQPIEEAERELHREQERTRWAALAAGVQSLPASDATVAVGDLRKEIRFHVAQLIRTHGTNGRSVDEVFEAATDAAVDAVRSYKADDQYRVQTRVHAAIVRAVRGTPGGSPRRSAT